MNFRFDLQRFAGGPNPEDLLVGAGKVFAKRFGSDVRYGIGNADSLGISSTVEMLKKLSSMYAKKETYAQTPKSVDFKATLVLSEFNPFNLSMWLYGEESVETQAARSIVDQVYKVTPGAVITVPYKDITNVVIKPLATTPSKIGNATTYAVSGTPGTGKITASGKYIGVDNDAYYITITKANSAVGTITDVEFTWSKGLMGTASAPVKVGSAAQVLDEGVSVTFTKGTSGQDFVLGEVYEIKVTAEGGGYIAGKDYFEDKTQLRGGVIAIPNTTSIAEGELVRVSYDVPEKQYFVVTPGVAKSIDVELTFIGDPTYGKPCVVEIWHASVTPSGDFGLIGDDWGSLTLEMDIIPDRINHPDHPFFKYSGPKD